MHKCSKCGKEFEGQFCPACGEKWVDPNACPKCGAHLASLDVTFCPSCGARLDGKVACPKCGAAMEEGVAFCTVCGAELKGTKKAKAEAAVADGGNDEGNGDSKVKKILSLVGVICFLVAALVGFIFTFVAGVTQTNKILGYGTESETRMLWYYFGDAYKNLDLLEGTSSVAIYVQNSLGALISVLGIVSTLVFGIITLVKVIKKFAKKQNVSVIGPAVGTFLSFAAMSTLLLAIVVEGGDYSRYGSYSVGFSGATLAGLILGGIAVAAGTVLLVVANIKSLKGVGNLVSFIMMAVGCVLVIVVMGLVGAPAVKLSSDEVSVNGSFGLFAGLNQVVGAVSDDTLLGILILSMFGTLVGMALVIVVASALIKNIAAMANGKKRTNLGYGISIIILTIVFLAFAILTKEAIINGLLTDAYGVPEEYLDSYKDMISSSYVAPIAMVVMSVMTLAVVIAGKVFAKKYNLEGKKADQPEAQQ